MVPFGVSHYGVWAASKDDVPETLIAKIDNEKCMISILWSTSGIHRRLVWTKGMKYNSPCFCQLLFRMSSKRFAHRDAENIEKYSILLYLDKEPCIYLLGQNEHQGTSSSLVI
jgi:hypothetical protein